ncbi:MAG: TIGR01458 family HAD-type hydrolase [Halothiobacillaceae bacterium]|nr:TIGR01458 family HAD-type hydrolase [Halothiobacillaceae bacterium]
MTRPGIDGVLLDIGGVLMEGDAPLPGSVAAVDRLTQAGVPFGLITNTTRVCSSRLLQRLRQMGFELDEARLFTPARLVRGQLARRGLRPFLLVHPDLMPDFSGLDTQAPNAVVLGDAGPAFTYERLNAAFRLLRAGAPLLSLGDSRFFRDADGLLSLDIAPFARLLESAADVRAEVFGKPAPRFFLGALQALGVAPSHALMVGDDVDSDVLGALALGMHGALVRSGKFHPGDEARLSGRDARVYDTLALVVDSLLEGN